MKDMASAKPRTFGDLERAGLEMAVTCQCCGHQAVIDDTSPKLRNRPIAGRRYRCQQCGAIGLPSLGTRRLAQRVGERLNKLDWSGELPGRKVDRRR